jgi:CheY-like chemotaxis protein
MIAKTAGRRSVLVVDDEPYVRDAVADILQSEGLPVIVATSGEEGVKQYRQHQAEIGVVLLDMKMPGMSGEETHRVLRDLNAEVKVILSSGYHEAEVNRTWRELGIFAFLQKPYKVDLLLHYVQQALAVTS